MSLLRYGSANAAQSQHGAASFRRSIPTSVPHFPPMSLPSESCAPAPSSAASFGQGLARPLNPRALAGDTAL